MTGASSLRISTIPALWGLGYSQYVTHRLAPGTTIIYHDNYQLATPNYTSHILPDMGAVLVITPRQIIIYRTGYHACHSLARPHAICSDPGRQRMGYPDVYPICLRYHVIHYSLHCVILMIVR